MGHQALKQNAIVLRFFEQLDFASLNEAFGSKEQAARKRVSRALDKLQKLLAARGVTLSVAALSTALAARAVEAAPAAVVANVAKAVDWEEGGRIQKRNRDGRWSLVPGQFTRCPILACDHSGNLYAAEYGKIQNETRMAIGPHKRDATGNWSEVETDQVPGGVLVKPWEIAVDSTGALYEMAMGSHLHS